MESAELFLGKGFFGCMLGACGERVPICGKQAEKEGFRLLTKWGIFSTIILLCLVRVDHLNTLSPILT